MSEPDDSCGGKLQVKVAAWGPAFGYPEVPVFDGEQFADQGPGVPYKQRARVRIAASPGVTLGQVIDEAAACFGVRSQGARSISEQVHCVAFYRDGDEAGMEYDYDRWHAAVRTVDTAGEPSWAVRWSVITLEELIAASDAGLVVGDPLRPYFWPVIPQGDAVDVVTRYGHCGITGRTSSRISRPQRRRPAWDARQRVTRFVLFAEPGTRPLRITTRGRPPCSDQTSSWPLWGQTPRTTSEIAARTGLSTAQVTDGLPGLGYVLGPDGRWHPAAHGVAAMLRQGMLDIKRAGRGPDLEEAAERVRTLTEAQDD